MDAKTRQIAKQRIQTLLDIAKDVLRQDSQLSQRYLEMARRIAMSARLRLPPEYRLQVCGHCKSFILPGINCRVRLQQKREPHVVLTCLKCGRQTRIRLIKKQEFIER